LFGYSVSLSNDRAIIGAHGNDNFGNDNGAAYIFDFNNNKWTQTQKLVVSSDTNEVDFGFSVKIDGDKALVGAYKSNINNNNTGSVYFYKFIDGIWVLTQRLLPNDTSSGQQFGYAISTFNNRALITALLDDENGINSGSVYEFDLSFNTWNQNSKITSNTNIGAAYDTFGSSVSLSGNKALIGSPFDDDNGHNSGAAYLFELINGEWVLIQKIFASNGKEYDFFGYSVSLSGNMALIGSPQISTELSNGNGQAYVFERINNKWVESQVLSANDGTTGDNFGFAVSLDLNKALIGANEDKIGSSRKKGSAYFFDYTQSTGWIETQKIIVENDNGSNLFGSSVLISGDKAIIGAPKKTQNDSNIDGAVYVLAFDPDSNLWSHTQLLTSTYFSESTIRANFGTSLDLNGTRLIIGAPNDKRFTFNSGAVYIYNLIEGNWVVSSRLLPRSAGAIDGFGFSVKISENRAVIGSFRQGVNSGFEGGVYIFDYNGSHWYENHIIKANNGAFFDNFGVSLGLDGNTLLVGANNYDTDRGTNSGAAFIYDITELIFSDGFEPSL
jgi:hypothetical protein